MESLFPIRAGECRISHSTVIAYTLEWFLGGHSSSYVKHITILTNNMFGFHLLRLNNPNRFGQANQSLDALLLVLHTTAYCDSYCQYFDFAEDTGYLFWRIKVTKTPFPMKRIIYLHNNKIKTGYYFHYSSYPSLSYFSHSNLYTHYSSH